MTTKVNLIHGKKNAHSSEEFSGEWAVLYNGVLYMSLATFSIEVAIFEMKLPLFYGRFPHFPHYFPHFPYLIGYTHLAKLLYGALLLRCKLNIILNGKRTSLRWCG